jgi:DNA helicase-2/ATP-dependent DNA helicase PcrA
MFDPILSNLNEKQKEAVMYTEGALLVLAGAGSGKTRVITHRFAYIIREKKVSPFNILAVTFTNKAALEMKTRISNLLGYDVSNIWVRTFHSTGLMILRQNSEYMDYPKDFVVYDDVDSKAIVKSILAEMNLSAEKFSPATIAERISWLKDRMISPDDFYSEIKGQYDKVVYEVYIEYEKKLKKNKAVDYSDLINLPVKMFKEYPEILEKYQKLWRYIMVDEFQDTNRSQYEFLKLVGDAHKNICVVGDDDQSIYGWRGADVNNIYDFKERYNAKVIPLDQNYRSTPLILEAANSIVKKIHGRMQKKLWTQQKSGEKIKIFNSFTEKEEARWVVSEIETLLGKYDYKDFAIFYRTNAQSRIFEEELLFKNIPYRVFGGQKFYSRKEIKDVLAYIKFTVNPEDWFSFERIVDVPKRGIGEATLKKIRKLYEEENIPILEILFYPEHIERLNKVVADSLKELGMIIKELNEEKENISPTNFVKILLDSINYKDYLHQYEENGKERWENVEELINSIKIYEQSNPHATIVDYISDITLQTSADEIGTEEERNYISLMTIHNAKGLEFPVVFITGAVDGLIPHSSAAEMDEERRLFYVAITRAKEKLYITFSRKRLSYGIEKFATPSPFLFDIPEECIEEIPVYYNYLSKRKDFDFEEETEENDINTYNYDKVSDFSSLKKGMKIFHNSFGVGEIAYISDNILKVNFKDYGSQIITKTNLSSIRIIE